MGFLVKVSLPVEAGNLSAKKDGFAAIQNILQQQKPKAAYFLPQAGQRTGILIMNLQDPSEIPAISKARNFCMTACGSSALLGSNSITRLTLNLARAGPSDLDVWTSMGQEKFMSPQQSFTEHTSSFLVEHPRGRSGTRQWGFQIRNTHRRVPQSQIHLQDYPDVRTRYN